MAKDPGPSSAAGPDETQQKSKSKSKSKPKRQRSKKITAQSIANQISPDEQSTSSQAVDTANENADADVDMDADTESISVVPPTENLTFEQRYLQQITAEFADDIDALRQAPDFVANPGQSLEVLVEALRMGVDRVPESLRV